VVELADRVAAMAERSKAKRREQRHAEIAAAEVKQAVQAGQREAMRLAMPEVAGLVDTFKSVFGDDQVRVLAAKENGRSVLNRVGLSRVCIGASNYE